MAMAIIALAVSSLNGQGDGPVAMGLDFAAVRSSPGKSRYCSQLWVGSGGMVGLQLAPVRACEPLEFSGAKISDKLQGL